jgi:hypothetical protein
VSLATSQTVRLASVRVCKRGRGVFVPALQCSAAQKLVKKVPIAATVRFFVAHAGGPWPGILGYDAVHMEMMGVCVCEKGLVNVDFEGESQGIKKVGR